MTKTIKQKKCKNKGCENKFTPFNSIQNWCSPACGVEIAQAKVKKKYKNETRAMKRKLNENDRSYQLKLAQQEFNAFIRLRDKNQSCISCGTREGKINAGHYLSAGGHPELRFNENNCHVQCERCNSWLSGNVARYRINLITKIGLTAVEQLEGPQEALKLTLDDIKAIKLKYREKRKKLESQLSEVG